MIQRTVAEIRMGALRRNFSRLAGMAAPGVLIPVVKADAFGHGAVPVSLELERAGASHLAVVSLDEALELRAAGVRAELLVMGVVDAGRTAEVLSADCAVAVHSMAQALAFQAAARAAGATVRLHVKVDTGMNRLGMSESEAYDLIWKLTDAPGVLMEGLMSHMHMADECDLVASQAQIRQMTDLEKQLTERNLRPPMVHLANSAGLLRFPAARFDGVRSGLAVYGLSPCPELTGQMSLEPVMRWRTAVALVKPMARGEGISYGHTWHAERPSLVAALPVGYADGYCRSLSNVGRVRIGAHLVPVIGRVCMDTTMIDVTDVPAVDVGTPVVLMEADVECPISAYGLAQTAGTNTYELLTGIGRRVRRVAVEE